MTVADSRILAPAAAVTVLCAAGVATFALLIPEAILSSPRNDLAPIVATVFAVVAAAGLQRSGSVRTAWTITAGATLVLGSLRYLAPSDMSEDTLTTMGLVAAGVTGVLLGAVVVAAWDSRSGPWALLTGVWSAFVTAAAVGVSVPVDSLRWTVPQWLLVIALVGAVAAVVSSSGAARTARIDSRTVSVAVITAAALTAGYRLLGGWVRETTSAGGATMWLVAIGSLVAIVVAAEVVARLVPGGDDRFVLAVTGSVLAVYPVMIELWGGAPWWVPIVVVASVAAAATLAHYVPYPAAGLAVALAVSTAAVVWPAFAETVPLPVRAALVAAGAALALATSVPGSTSIAALGLTLPVPLTATIGAVWLMPTEPMWTVMLFAAAGLICAWQIR